MNPVYNDGKVIGHITNETYFTNRNPVKHFMRKYNGYGISYDVLLSLKEQGIEFIVIKVEEIRHKFHIDDYLNSSLKYTNKSDIQHFVPVGRRYVQANKKKRLISLESWGVEA